MESQAFVGSGDLYIDRLIGNAWRGYMGPYGASKFEIKMDTDIKESVSLGRYTFGQVQASVALPKPSTLKVTLDTMDNEGMGMALGAESAALVDTGAALSAHSLAIATLDVWYPLPNENFTGAFTVTQSSATLVEGVDYAVNREFGWVKALRGGAIAAGSSVSVTGTATARTGVVMLGGRQAQIICRFRLDGVNYADGKRVQVYVPRAILSSQATVNFLGRELADTPLEGRMQIAQISPGVSAPFQVITLD